MAVLVSPFELILGGGAAAVVLGYYLVLYLLRKRRERINRVNFRGVVESPANPVNRLACRHIIHDVAPGQPEHLGITVISCRPPR